MYLTSQTIQLKCEQLFAFLAYIYTCIPSPNSLNEVLKCKIGISEQVDSQLYLKMVSRTCSCPSSERYLLTAKYFCHNPVLPLPKTIATNLKHNLIGLDFVVCKGKLNIIITSFTLKYLFYAFALKIFHIDILY